MALLNSPIAVWFLGGYSHSSQKVYIASALMASPTFCSWMNLREPIPRARLVKDILRRVANDGGAVFVSTHVLEIAERMCDRVGIIQRAASLPGHRGGTARQSSSG